MHKDDFLQGANLFSKEVNMVKQYLFDVETWGRFELNMFSNLLFIFDHETIVFYLDNAINNILKYSEDPIYGNLLSAIILNGCTLASERKNTCLLSKFLNLFDKFPNTPIYFYLKTHQIFYQEIYSYIKSGTIQMERAKAMLFILEQSGYQNHKYDLEKLLYSITT